MIREEGIRIPFAYAAGRAGSRFLAVLRDEQRILASRCTTCGRVSVPLRAVCPQCAALHAQEVEVGPGGTLLAWTGCDSGDRFLLVRLDGADGGFVHRLLGAVPDSAIGRRVRARFAEQRRADIRDIEGFVLEEECR